MEENVVCNQITVESHLQQNMCRHFPYFYFIGIIVLVSDDAIASD